MNAGIGESVCHGFVDLSENEQALKCRGSLTDFLTLYAAQE